MTNKTKYTYKFSYRHAFLVPLIVMVAGCIGAGIFPFGNQSFLRNDLYNQYVQFFAAFRDAIWRGEGLSYTFNLGLGSSYSALYGYYLASPTNWLVLLCPKALIGEFITILIILKMGLSGVTFAHYLKKHFGQENIGLLFFGSAYALSGFMAAYQWNVMWLDVVLLMPLVLLALEELFETGKGTKYCALLALCILSNFYLSIMLCIFLVLYFLVLAFTKPMRVVLRSGVKFAFYSLLAGGIASCILLPVYFALSGTEFSEFNFPETAKWYMNGLELLSRHCMIVSMKVQADHWPNVYCGVAMFLLIPLYILNKKINLKEKIDKLLLMAFILVSFALNMLDFIWHGFNYPDSLPGRQSYLYIWLLLVMGYEVYLKLRYTKSWHVMVATLVSYLVIASAWAFTDVVGMDWWTYVFSLIFVFAYSMILLAMCLWRIPRIREQIRTKKWKTLFQNRYLGVKVIVGILVLLELSANMYATSIRTVNRTTFMEHYTGRKDAVAFLKDYDDGLYRTEIFNRLTKNDGMMWGVPTATVFSSTVNANVVELYKKLGMGTTRVSYWHQGATPLSSAMLGVKYMLGKDASQENDLYDIIYTDETGYVYESNYTAPIGYVLPPSLEETWNTQGYYPIQMQNEFCNLLGVEGELFTPFEAKKLDDRTQTITVDQDSYVYVYIGKNSISEIEMTKGEETTKFTQVSFDYLLDVGLVKKGEEVTLTITKEDEVWGLFKPHKLNLDLLEKATAKMNETPLNITEHKAGYLKGNVSLDEAGQLVIAIPNDKGWVLTVNGEETEIDTFKDAFMALDLEAGEYEIVLKFKSPGVTAGLVVSILSIGLLLFLMALEKRGPHSRVEHNDHREQF